MTMYERGNKQNNDVVHGAVPETSVGAGDLSRQQGAFVAPAKDPSSIPRTKTVVHNHLD